MKSDHIGYAVKRMDRAVSFFKVLGYRFKAAVDDRERNLRVSFGEKGGYHIELVQLLTRKNLFPGDAYLSRIDSMPYHFCYKSGTIYRI